MIKNDDRRKKIADDLSVLEEMGELSGTPTEAIAVPVSMFNDYNNQVQIVKNSSYERNQTLDQAMRQDYAQWRLSLAQLVPVNAKALIEWVNEAYEIPPDTFELGATQTQAQQQQQMGMASGGQPQQGQGNAGQIAQGNQPQKPQQSKMQAGPVKPQVKQAPGGLALMGM